MAPETAAGRVAPCPKCGTWNQIPAATAPVPPQRVLAATRTQPAPHDQPPANDFITLACPSCAGSLKITSDADRFACKYCGREHLVRRQNGILTVTPVLEKLDRIVSGVDRSASELAIPRLKRECRAIERRIADAWDYIDSWKDFEGQKSSGAITTGVTIGAIGLVLSLCGAAFHWTVTVVGVVFTIGLCALAVFLSRPDKGRIEEKVRKARMRIEDLEDSLPRRRKELRTHYDNVRI